MNILTTTRHRTIDRAVILRLRENLLDEDLAVDAARAEVDRAVEQLRGCVARRNLTAYELADLLTKAA